VVYGPAVIRPVTDDDHTDDVEAIVSEYRNAWGDRAYDAVPDLVAPSFVMYDPVAPGGAVRGPDGLVSFMRSLQAGFPDLASTMHASLSSGDLLLCETSVTGTHEGAFGGHDSTGRRFEVRALEKFRAADGRLLEHRVCFDPATFREQLGLDGGDGV